MEKTITNIKITEKNIDKGITVGDLYDFVTQNNICSDEHINTYDNEIELYNLISADKKTGGYFLDNYIKIEIPHKDEDGDYCLVIQFEDYEEDVDVEERNLVMKEIIKIFSPLIEVSYMWFYCPSGDVIVYRVGEDLHEIFEVY